MCIYTSMYIYIYIYTHIYIYMCVYIYICEDHMPPEDCNNPRSPQKRLQTQEETPRKQGDNKKTERTRAKTMLLEDHDSYTLQR